MAYTLRHLQKDCIYSPPSTKIWHILSAVYKNMAYTLRRIQKYGICSPPYTKRWHILSAIYKNMAYTLRRPQKDGIYSIYNGSHEGHANHKFKEISIQR